MDRTELLLTEPAAAPTGVLEADRPAHTAAPTQTRNAAAPRPAVRPRVRESLFRVVWRWHFYAGMIISPVLIVMSITGALFIFRSEVEELVHADTLFIKERGVHVTYQAQVDAAVAAHPGYSPSQLQIYPEADRATLVTLRPASDQGKPPSREAFRRSLIVGVDPYDGKVLGSVSGASPLRSFFDTVLTIHRTLWAGTIGRILTELTTSWSLVLIATGIYLWWPRKKAKAPGVWTVRWKTKLYTRLRDLHSVGGFYLFPICALIVATGMFYTLTAGTMIHQGAKFWVGASKSAPQAGKAARKPQDAPPPKALPLDQLLATMKAQYPGQILFASLGGEGGRRRRGKAPAPANSMEIRAGNDFNRTYGPMVSSTVTLDKSSGRILKRTKNSEEEFFWHAWTYPLHVGSFWGVSTKILWFAACVILTALPITGLWMWWERRPKGKLGLPRKPEVPMSWWLATLIATLCFVLPMMGASVVLILIGEAIVRGIRRFRRPAQAAA